MLNQPLPEWLSSQLVWAIPLLEGLAVFLLLYRPLRLWGFLLSSGLMLLFTGYVLLMLLGVFSYVPCPSGGMLEGLYFLPSLTNIACERLISGVFSTSFVKCWQSS